MHLDVCARLSAERSLSGRIHGGRYRYRDSFSERSCVIKRLAKVMAAIAHLSSAAKGKFSMLGMSRAFGWHPCSESRQDPFTAQGPDSVLSDF